MSWGTVELEPEVRDWFEWLPTARFANAAFYVDLLAEARMRDDREVDRARRALARCIAEEHDTQGDEQ